MKIVSSTHRFLLAFVTSLLLSHSISADDQISFGFIKQACLDCHDSGAAEGKLDLQSLAFDPDADSNFATWTKIHDRVRDGEMPPPGDDARIDEASKQDFLSTLAGSLRVVNLRRQKSQGRVQYRRLSRTQYENTLRDLLDLPNLSVRDMLPEDPTEHGFDNIGSALNLSEIQMARYLEAADFALRKAIVLTEKPPSKTVRLVARENGRFRQVVGKGREAVPVGDAVGLLRQPNTAQAPWFWSKFAPPVDGRYRIRMKTFGFYWDAGEILPADRGHVVTFQAMQGSAKRPLTTLDVPPESEDTAPLEFETFLRVGDQVQIWFESLDDRTKPGQLSLADYAAPGVAVEWLEIEGPLGPTGRPTSYERLFADLPVEPYRADSGYVEPPIPIITSGVGKRAVQVPAKPKNIQFMRVVPQHSGADAQRMLLRFAEKAFRRPVGTDEIVDFVALTKTRLDQNQCFQEAMRIGFQAILCSPEFLFLDESPGRLDGHALASRLSYFLWNSMPDDELLSLAADGQLHDAAVLKEQIERMLDDQRSDQFIASFCGQWMDLRRITATQPDEHLYPEYDKLLLDSMVRESIAYFRHMIDANLGVEYLVDSDFVFANERLARLYDIPAISGVAIRKISLPETSPRGGLLGQAAILKVTANGTSTSPVTRGVWLLDRLLGQPPNPPPPNVKAVEPDLRGTTTIRQQLDQHRDVAACASCHRKIDPPGFALECFDVIGGYRDRYRSLEQGDDVEATFKNDRPVRYKLGLPVDSSGVAPAGQAFNDVHEFRKILLQERRQLAKNMVEKLLVYSTGSGIEFADRQVVETILRDTLHNDHGLRSIIHSIVQSDLFQSK